MSPTRWHVCTSTIPQDTLSPPSPATLSTPLLRPSPFSGAEQQVKYLPDTADVRYLLVITCDIAQDREASVITDALWEERVRAKDRILRHLEGERERSATNTPHPDDLIAAYIDCAVTAPWQSERAFWLRAAATVIKSTPSEDHLHLYRRAARRVQATYSLPNRERQAAIQTLAALLQPLR